MDETDQSQGEWGKLRWRPHRAKARRTRGVIMAVPARENVCTEPGAKCHLRVSLWPTLSPVSDFRFYTTTMAD